MTIKPAKFKVGDLVSPTTFHKAIHGNGPFQIKEVKLLRESEYGYSDYLYTLGDTNIGDALFHEKNLIANTRSMVQLELFQ